MTINRAQVAMLLAVFTSGFLFAADPELDKPKVTLVAKTPEAFLSYLPLIDPDQWFRSNREGGSLLYTSRETAQMKVLLTSATWSDHRRRQTYFQTRILGVAADNQRIYVLAVSVAQMDRRPEQLNKPMNLDTPEAGKSQRPARATFTLNVYRLKDGELLASQELKGDRLPKSVTAETTGVGPLSLIKNGVEVYGVKLEFDERGELKKP